MGHTERLGIAHGLHPETAAHIGGGDADIGRIKIEVACQIPLGHPDALPVQRHVQTTVRDLGKASARLHCIGNDAVVHHIDGHDMGGLGNAGLRCGLIP